MKKCNGCKNAAGMCFGVLMSGYDNDTKIWCNKKQKKVIIEEDHSDCWIKDYDRPVEYSCPKCKYVIIPAKKGEKHDSLISLVMSGIEHPFCPSCGFNQDPKHSGHWFRWL